MDNLQSIQRQVVNYWRKKEFLPEKLTDLNDEIGGYNVPVDPETNESYGYNIKGDESFELCAVFNLPSDSLELKNSAQSSRPLTINKGRDWNWEHTSGNVCFERTIDDELYPPFDNVRLQEYPLD